jgi:intracellular multiplication protein IcmD
LRLKIINFYSRKEFFVMNKKMLKNTLLCVCGLSLFGFGAAAFALSGVGSIASNVTSNLGSIAKLITAASYVAGMAFAVGAVIKFKAHKDNPTQVTIGMPIALLFVAAALIFIPEVFSSAGSTLFGTSGATAGVSGVTSFGS